MEADRWSATICRPAVECVEGVKELLLGCFLPPFRKCIIINQQEIRFDTGGEIPVLFGQESS